MTQQILDAAPYAVFPHPPLYLLATRLVNVFPGDLLLAGRALSLLYGLGIGVALALLLRNRRESLEIR